MKIKPITTSILLFIIMSSAALALPPLPTKWWGSVSINGSLVTEGEMRAYVNSTFSANTFVVGDGLYAIDVPCLSGDIVVLRFGEILTTGELACSPGDFFELNFTDCTTPCGVHEICNITDDQCYTALQCSDGTFYSECSTTQPLYCNDGSLVNRCDICGCPSGQSCGSDNSCFTPTSPSGPGGSSLSVPSSGGSLPPAEEEEEIIGAVVIPSEEVTEEAPEVEEVPPAEEEEVMPLSPVGFFFLSPTDWLIAIVSGIVIALFVILLAKRKRKKK